MCADRGEIHVVKPKEGAAGHTYRYIVWVSVRQFYLCETLAYALRCKEIFGGTIYEPLAMTAIEKINSQAEIDPITGEDLTGKTKPCCDCAVEYPRADLIIRGEVFCPICREKPKWKR